MSLHRDFVGRIANTAEIVVVTAVLDHNAKHVRGEASPVTVSRRDRSAGNRCDTQKAKLTDPSSYGTFLLGPL